MDIVKLIGMIPGAKPILKTLFKKQYLARIRKGEEYRRKCYKENGLKAATLFHSCMEECGFNYVAAYGTMLGAIREHGFIKHDLDLDFWMWIEHDTPDIVTALSKYGFKLHSHYSVDNDKLGKELTFDYKGCHVDIFFIYPPINKVTYSTLFIPNDEGKKNLYQPVRIELPVSREKRKEKFENIELYVPSNVEELCTLRYGPNYMTPNPEWDWKTATECVVEWTEMVAVTKVQHY